MFGNRRICLTIALLTCVLPASSDWVPARTQAQAPTLPSRNQVPQVPQATQWPQPNPSLPKATPSDPRPGSAYLQALRQQRALETQKPPTAAAAAQPFEPFASPHAPATPSAQPAVHHSIHPAAQRTIHDQNGQPLPLPAVCLSDLPGLELPNRDPPVETDPNQSASQWRESLRQLLQDEPAAVAARSDAASFAPQPQRAMQVRTAQYQAIAAAAGNHPIARAAYADPHEPDPAYNSGHSQPAISAAGMYNPHAKATAAGFTADLTPQAAAEHQALAADPNYDPHEAVFSASLFPSAVECAKCHQQIFDEWASSSHAYAAISPMFHRFEDTINRLSQGTIGYFCLRCHAPVATTVGLRRDQPIWDGPRVFREGITCIACHHVQEINVKTNGDRRIEPGDLSAPVTAAGNGEGVEAAIKFKDHFKVKTDPHDKSTGQLIHRRTFKFPEIAESTFCVSCHQVAVQPGIKLEVVWDQYRASPAWKEGISCQDCHMGKVPGVAEGYTLGPGAVVDGRVVNPLRKHSNHVFYGPGYSIAHPGIFPHDPAQDRWTVNQWLEFDWQAGWGTDEFEDRLAQQNLMYHFPAAWQHVDDRYDAREIVNKNLQKLEYKRQLRRQVLENGSQIEGPFFADTPTRGQPLAFEYCVINKSNGHNMPSGSLGAQPQLWLNTVLIGPDGQRLWESGYLDSHGDLADLHSLDVLDRKIPLDKQLFNLQTKFLTTNVKGTDREMYLPVNFDFDQLPFLRPPSQPVTVINHPPFIRMEGHSIPALGQRKAKYRIPGHLLQQPGVYRLSVRMRSRAEPIYFMKFVGSTPEMINSMNRWIVDIHPDTVAFEVR